MLKTSLSSQFVESIHSLLPCRNSEKKRMLSDFKDEVSQYVEENNVQHIEELYDHFGTPECIALTYSDTLAIPAKTRRFKIILASLMTFIFITLLLVAVLTIVNFVKTVDYQDGYYVKTIGVERDDDYNMATNSLEYYTEAK